MQVIPKQTQNTLHYTLVQMEITDTKLIMDTKLITHIMALRLSGMFTSITQQLKKTTIIMQKVELTN